MKISDKKEFAIVTLNSQNKTFILYIVTLEIFYKNRFISL